MLLQPDEIKSNSDQVKCSEPFSFLINRKDIKDHISKLMAKTPASMLLQPFKDIILIQVPVETSLQRFKLVGLSYVPVGTLLQHLIMAAFIYVPERCRKNGSNRPVLLTYQLRRHDVVSAWSGTLILVTKMDQFYMVPASTSLQRLKDVGLILSISCDVSATC